MAYTHLPPLQLLSSARTAEIRGSRRYTEDVQGDFPVVMQETHVVISYVDREADFVRPIGYTTLPSFRMQPGDVVDLSLTVHMELQTQDFWGGRINQVLIGGGRFVQRAGPMTVGYEIEPSDTPFGNFVSWVVGDSNLKQRYTFMCDTLLDVTKNERLEENCTAVPEVGIEAIERTVDTISLSMMITGSLFFVLAVLAFFRHVRVHRDVQTKSPRKRRASLADVELTYTNVGDDVEAGRGDGLIVDDDEPALIKAEKRRSTYFSEDGDDGRRSSFFTGVDRRPSLGRQSLTLGARHFGNNPPVVGGAPPTASTMTGGAPRSAETGENDVVRVAFDGPRLGLNFGDDGSVAAVQPGGEAEAKGVRPGDRVIGVAGTRVVAGASKAAAVAAIRGAPARPLVLEISRRDVDAHVFEEVVIEGAKLGAAFGAGGAVTGVARTGEAFAKGVRTGDVCACVGASPTSDADAVKAAVKAHPARPLRLTFVRRRDGARPAFRDVIVEGPRLGLAFDENGLVDGVRPGGEAETLGVRPGDAVACVGSTPCGASRAEVVAAIKAHPSRPMRITLRTDPTILHRAAAPGTTTTGDETYERVSAAPPVHRAAAGMTTMGDETYERVSAGAPPPEERTYFEETKSPLPEEEEISPPPTPLTPFEKHVRDRSPASKGVPIFPASPPMAPDIENESPQTPKSPYRRMSVKELRKAANSEGVDLAGCFEKAEMASLLEERTSPLKKNAPDMPEANVFVTLESATIKCVFAGDGSVESVEPDSEAAAKGLRKGDRIVQVARKPVRADRLAIAAAFRAHPGRPLHLFVHRTETSGDDFVELLFEGDKLGVAFGNETVINEAAEADPRYDVDPGGCRARARAKLDGRVVDVAAGGEAAAKGVQVGDARGPRGRIHR